MWNLDDKKVRAEMAKTIPFSNVHSVRYDRYQIKFIVQKQINESS